MEQDRAHGEQNRRTFLKAAGAGAAVTTGVLGGTSQAHAASRRPAARVKVAVLGGGVAGLSAAHELIERGFDVAVYERKALGGKARGIPAPGEHGYCFFPAYYRDLTDTMRRTPFPGNPDGTWGNLVHAPSAMMSHEGWPHLTTPFPVPRIHSLQSLIGTVASGARALFGLPRTEALFFAQKVAVYMASCDERRLKQWENISWADFIRADRMSDEYNTFLAATKCRDAGAHAIGLLGEVTLWSALGLGNEPGASGDRVLNGPTGEMWIDPWVAHLRDLGVEFHVGWTAGSLAYEGGRIASAGATDSGGAARTIEADHFIVAMPCERAAGLLGRPILNADPALGGIARLRSWSPDPAAADEPLFVPTPGSWMRRPRPANRIPNLFFAGDWVQTPGHVATMEGANQGARLAVNALLDAAGSGEPRCGVHEPYRPPVFEPAKNEDAARFKAGLPHRHDLLDTRWP